MIEEEILWRPAKEASKSLVDVQISFKCFVCSKAGEGRRRARQAGFLRRGQRGVGSWAGGCLWRGGRLANLLFRGWDETPTSRGPDTLCSPNRFSNQPLTDPSLLVNSKDQQSLKVADECALWAVLQSYRPPLQSPETLKPQKCILKSPKRHQFGTPRKMVPKSHLIFGAIFLWDSR